MSWIALFLGLILTLAGGAALVASLDLTTTELGLLYATCGAIGLSGGFITIAIGLLIRRVDALRHAFFGRSEAKLQERSEPIVPPLLAGIEPVVVPEPSIAYADDAAAPAFSPATAAEPPAMSDDADDREATLFNENRKEHPPAPQTPEPPRPEQAQPPTLVGRYGAGGANYSIFSDGSIEAETDQGAFKFASMGDFKAYIAAKRT
jgi:hypothetical protein